MTELAMASAPAIPLFIGGAFIESAAPELLRKTSPATGEMLAIVPDAGEAEVDSAVTSAREAFDGEWRRARAASREAALRMLADLIEENADHLAHIEAEDSGIPLFLTRGGSLPRAIGNLRHFAAEAVRIGGESCTSDGAYRHFTTREPIGVAAIIVPWNAPLSIATLNIGAALACGSTCVIKAPELAPRPMLELARLVAAADLPPGTVNVVFGGERAGRALVRHRGVDVVSFTGGTVTAREIMRDAAESMKRVVLELGGKSPNIIFADAPLDEAVDAALLAAFASNGALCTAGSRILVEREAYDRFMDAFAERAAAIRVGDPLSLDTEVGPMISESHRDRVLAAINRAMAEGAKLVAGGETRGNFIRPAVLSGVNNSMSIARQEVFGPVAAVIPFDGEEEAIAVANDTDYGLAAFVWTSDMQRALRVSAEVRAGAVAINSPIIRDLRLPFGGFKQSGIGRVGGHYSIDTFTEVKTTSIPIRPYPFPRFGAPRKA
ncbi:MAG: aldehyde dehydrogenase family protein [Acidobacteriota bacterium]|nr:aldehyde dehydrogenase family protein [Acidobacteriota bacterium]